MPAIPDHDTSHNADHAALARAARAAETAAALFAYDDAGAECRATVTCGRAAAACAYVAGHPWGARACRLSRATAARAALCRDRATPFVCHLGFACVAAPVHTQTREVVVMGPFLAVDSADPVALAAGVRDGLDALPLLDPPTPSADAPLPFTLDDLPVRPAESVLAAAEWCAESLRTTRRPPAVTGTSVDADGAGESPSRAPRRRRVAPRVPDPYDATAIAAAVAAGNTARVRRMVASVLTASIFDSPLSADAARARATAVAAAVLERADAAGLDLTPAWRRWDAFQRSLSQASTAKERVDAVAQLLRTLRPDRMSPAATDAPPADIGATLAALDPWLAAQWPEPVTLEAAAAAVGLKPATLTKRLQRALDLPFTQYVNRRRVTCAKELLVQTGLSVADIAKRVGVDDAANLARLFRRHEGMSPGQYRRRYQR